MSQRRAAPVAALLVAAVTAAIAAGACGGDKPPARTATAARAPVVRGEAAPTGTTARSLGDSALAPAAEDALAAEDWKRAEDLFRELGRRQPDNARARQGLGAALLRQDRHQEAADALGESLRLKDQGKTRIDLARAYAGLGRYPSALPHLRKAVALAPREPAAWAMLAEVLLKVEKPDSAMESLRESQRACPACAKDEGWGRVADEVAREQARRASRLAGSGDQTGARKALDAATGLRPDLPEAHLAAARIERAKGDRKAAAGAYRKAIPGVEGEEAGAARLELAALLLDSGEPAEAATVAEQAAEKTGNNPEALELWGRACDAAKDRDGARKAYERLVKADAHTPATKAAQDRARKRLKTLKRR
jgi:tetratricopeptide (TPR) repeat protein